MSHSNPMHRNPPNRGEPKDNSKRLDKREREMQRMKARNDKQELQLLNNGLVYLNAEDAKQRSDAMRLYKEV